MSWAAAFTLGAIVSPTDALAAADVVRRFNVPRRLVSILEGESLVNDGMALVLYKTAVAAAVAGSFSLWNASWHLVVNVIGGIGVGLAVGYVVRQVRRRVDDTPTEVAIALLSGYLAYLPAAALGVSGVLAAVTIGVYMGWYTPQLTTVETRLSGNAFWEILVFLVNALLFALVGFQLHLIASRLSITASLLADARARHRRRDRDAARLGAGLHLSAAPALPQHPRARSVSAVAVAGRARVGGRARRGLARRGARAAHRPAVPRHDRVRHVRRHPRDARRPGADAAGPDPRARASRTTTGADREDAKARIKAAEAALARLEELEAEDWVREDTVERMRGSYNFRTRRFRARYDGVDDDGEEERSQAYQRLRRELLDAERGAVLELRNEGMITEEVMQRVQRDIDLEDSRLDV